MIFTFITKKLSIFFNLFKLWLRIFMGQFFEYFDLKIFIRIINKNN